MKLLFVNPSLRPGSDHLFLPVGLGYVMTYAKEHGYSFELLDIDAANYSNEYVEKYFICGNVLGADQREFGIDRAISRCVADPIGVLCSLKTRNETVQTTQSGGGNEYRFQIIHITL